MASFSTGADTTRGMARTHRETEPFDTPSRAAIST
jgi:hypothetical protein